MRLERWSKFTRLALALALCGAVGVACDDDDDGPTGPTAEDLAGTWIASGQIAGTSFILTPDNPDFDPLNPILVGAEVTATVTANGAAGADGSFNLLVDIPDPVGLDDIAVGGTYTLDGNTITIETPIGTVSGTFSISSNGETTLTIQLDEVNLFDFDGDGEFIGDMDDEATLDATFQKSTS